MISDISDIFVSVIELSYMASSDQLPDSHKRYWQLP